VAIRNQSHQTDAADWLAAYDEQLRGEAETRGAVAVKQLGPLHLATFPGRRGFITYRGLAGADEGAIRKLVAEARSYFAADPSVTRVEWKTRGHDQAPGLHDALVDNGFNPEDPESIMLGRAELLAVDVTLPAGVTLRRVEERDDVRAMAQMQALVFGDDDFAERAGAILQHLRDSEELELWVAEHGGQIVSAGRLERVPGTQFAGIWGGATLPEWRGRGIYRALTAARARSALARGATLIHSDSTEFSRPILERAGLIKVATTTPYQHTPDRKLG
jgi:ribosomal protein S18 acetylase RimI-like enzyme